MIRPELVPDLTRLAPGYQPRMLMLGALESTIPGYPRGRDWFRQFVGDEYDELDLADGDLKLDLNGDLWELSQRYESVFNLGTLEHCWDVHRAWGNTLRAVKVGGWLLSHTPVAGWCTAEGYLDHGLHMTLRDAILSFLELNGFAIHDAWDTKWRNRGRIMWLRAEKVRHVERLEDFRPPLQVRGFSPTYRSAA
jgi:SAM-dependent methyltransferase